ncbi:MAG TPA: hypothetical protein VJ227_03100 [Patescibacteria group bacterium]|nr:hypothetical protein [Patescibacteria group bacterium]
MQLKKLLTVIYYTSNRENPAFEKKVKENLLKVIGDLPLISVSQKPIYFGENIVVGDVGVSVQNAFRQFQIGAQHAKTPFVIAAEADTLYPKEYFKFVPENINQCCVYDNVWFLDKKSKVGFVKQGYTGCAQVWGKDILIRHVDRRLKDKGQWNSKLEAAAKAPTMFGRPSWIYFHGETPVVSIKTPQGMGVFGKATPSAKPKTATKLPFWGTEKKLRKEMFS